MHFTVNDNSTETHIAALTQKSNETLNIISSDRLLHLTIVGNNCTTNEINLSNDYTSIEYLNGKFDQLIAVPLKKRDFEIITLSDNNFKTRATVETPHLLKYFQIQVYSTFFVTFGLDGLVNVWDTNTFEKMTSFFPHNKFFGGVRRCVANASRRFPYLNISIFKLIFYLNFRRYFLTLGSSNHLMCTELSNRFHIASKSPENDVASSDLRKDFAIELTPIGEGIKII